MSNNPTNQQKDLMVKHKAEACALSCIDFRLVDATVTELEGTSNNPFDYTAIPGASLFFNYADFFPDYSSSFLQTVQIARNLHDVDGIAIVQHQDCGAFRVVYPYEVDPKTGKIPPKREKELAIKNLKAAFKHLQKIHPDLYCKGYWLELSGKLRLVIEKKALVPKVAQ